MRKFFISTLLGLALGLGSTQAAEVVVKIAPPVRIVERRTAAPGPQHVWLAGYHRWDGRAYVWVPGHWEVPPRPHAVWVAPRWRHRRDGYVFVEGRWK